MSNTIQDLYYQKSKGSFTEKFQVPFMYCQVNESTIHAQKNSVYSAHVWYQSKRDPSRVLPDQITEGEGILVPQVEVSFFEDNVDKMRDCVASLEGEHDFASFEGSGSRDLSITDGRGAVPRPARR